MPIPNTATWGTGTITGLTNSSGVLQVMRDGQQSVAFATPQYSGPLVGDRVTLMLIGTQLYATGLIRSRGI